MICNTDKEQHYILQIYCSGKFPTLMIRLRKQEAVQDYAAAATTFVEAKEDGLNEVKQLTGDTPVAHGFGNINAVMEENFNNLLEHINSSVEERVNAAVRAGIDQVSKRYKQASRVATADLKTQVYDLKSTVYQFCDQIQILSSNINTGGNENKNPNTSNRNQTDTQNTFQHGGADDKTTWTTGLLWDNTWTQFKKRNHKLEYKRNEPSGLKACSKVRVVARQARELAKLD